MARIIDIEQRKRNAALKAAWQEQLLLDCELSHRAFRVASFIAWRFDKDVGNAVVGRQTIAEQLGVTDRTVDKAISELETLGHLRIERSRGRGLANTYMPILKDRGAGSTSPTGGENAKEPSPFTAAEKAKERSPQEEPENAKEPSPFRDPEKANIQALKGEDLGSKRRRNVRPLPIYSQYYSQRSDTALHAREEPQRALNEGGKSSLPKYPFGDRARHQRDLAKRLPGNALDNLARLDDLDEDRLQHWCRRQRDTPGAVDLAALEAELLAIAQRPAAEAR